MFQISLHCLEASFHTMSLPLNSDLQRYHWILELVTPQVTPDIVSVLVIFTVDMIKCLTKTT